MILIAAIDDKFGLNLNWDIPDDRYFFREAVKDKNVLCGWNTLQNDLKFGKIIPRTTLYLEDFTAYRNGECLGKVEAELDFCAGGAKTFNKALKEDKIHELWLTHVQGDFKCTDFLEVSMQDWEPLCSVFAEKYRRAIYVKRI